MKTSFDNLDPSRINLGLERMTQLMSRLGNPHERFESIHIAGTNGKGSTAAFLSSSLSAAGYRTGLYTSPHLERFSERIKIDNVEICADELEVINRQVEAAAIDLPGGEPTYFEFATALAFVYFAKKNVTIAVIETGLGGRLDATNIIKPLLSIITPISLDHADYLGDRLEGVASEKGGIIKDGVPLVSGRQDDEVNKILGSIACEKGAAISHFGRDFTISDEGGAFFSYRGPARSLKNVEISLLGAHQKENASLAIAALELLEPYGYNIEEGVLRGALRDAFWPGRFEVVSAKPDLVLDSAHNPGGARRLAETIAARYGERKGILIAGFMADKDIESMLIELLPFTSSVILARPDEGRAFDPEKDYGRVEEILSGREVLVIPSVKEALEKGIKLAKDELFIIITGSIYLVGEVRGVIKGSLPAPLDFMNLTG